MSDFNWNQKSIKAIFFDGEICNNRQEVLSPKEILQNPSRMEYSAITSALCKVVSELVALEEQRQNAMKNAMKAMQSIPQIAKLDHKEPDQPELPI